VRWKAPCRAVAAATLRRLQPARAMDVRVAAPATKRAAAGWIRLAPIPAYGALSAALFASAWHSGAALGDQMMAIDQGAPYAGMSTPRRLRLLSDLRRRKVDAVIVGRMDHQAAMVAMFTGLLGRRRSRLAAFIAGLRSRKRTE
jgi:hypothetical protein